MIEWAKRLLIAIATFWAGMVCMNFYWYTVFHSRSDYDWLGFIAQAAIPVAIAFAAVVFRWPGERKIAN